MEIGINRDTCKAYGLCVQFLPSNIALDDEFEPVVLASDVPEEQLAAAQQAFSNCPTRSIQLA